MNIKVTKHSEAPRELLKHIEPYFPTRHLGAYDWPADRGIGRSNDGTIVVLINYCDHLQFIFIDNQHYHFHRNLIKLTKVVKIFKRQLCYQYPSLGYSYDESFGYLTSFPLRSGSGISFSVIVKLSSISNSEWIYLLHEICDRNNIDVANCTEKVFRSSSSVSGSGGSIGAALETLPMASAAATRGSHSPALRGADNIQEVKYFKLTTRPRFQQKNMSQSIASLIEGLDSLMYFEQLLSQHGSKTAQISSILVNDHPPHLDDSHSSGRGHTMTMPTAANQDMNVALIPAYQSNDSSEFLVPVSSMRYFSRIISWFRQWHPFRWGRSGADAASGMSDQEIHQITRELMMTAKAANIASNGVNILWIKQPNHFEDGSSTSSDAAIDYDYFVKACSSTVIPVLVDQPLYESLAQRQSYITDFTFADTIRCVTESGGSALSKGGMSSELTVIAADANSYRVFEDFYSVLLCYTQMQQPKSVVSSCGGDATNDSAISLAVSQSQTAACASPAETGLRYAAVAEENIRSHMDYSKWKSFIHADRCDYRITCVELEFNEYSIDMTHVTEAAVDCSRNLVGFDFVSTIDRRQRRYVEHILSNACKDIEASLQEPAGSCHSYHYISLSNGATAAAAAAAAALESLATHLRPYGARISPPAEDSCPYYLSGKTYYNCFIYVSIYDSKRNMHNLYCRLCERLARWTRNILQR